MVYLDGIDLYETKDKYRYLSPYIIRKMKEEEANGMVGAHDRHILYFNFLKIIDTELKKQNIKMNFTKYGNEIEILARYEDKDELVFMDDRLKKRIYELEDSYNVERRWIFRGVSEILKYYFCADNILKENKIDNIRIMELDTETYKMLKQYKYESI